MVGAQVLVHLREDWGIQVLLSFALRVINSITAEICAGVELLVYLWRDRSIQLLVGLSFLLQVTLLITAEFRRRKDSGMLRTVVWSAYVMADTTAIYALGHLAVTSRSPEHQVMAFWAPFLLLHLGGQDNITAYAIEDNKLWVRHMQVLAVQVAAASYVLYESSIVGSQTLLKYASILMFVVGVLKYVERIWANRCASASINEPNQNYQLSDTPVNVFGFWSLVEAEANDIEDLLGRAHASFHIPNKLLGRPLVRPELLGQWNRAGVLGKLFTLGEMQLSLMHDVLYTKADVMHTWYGLCIRIISCACTAVAFVLVHRSGQADNWHGYSTPDVAVTYILLVGAIVLETMSLLRTMFSSWVLSDIVLRCPHVGTASFFAGWPQNLRGLWDFLRKQLYNMSFHVILCVRRLVLPERRKWWSDSMGQYNLFELYDHRKTSRMSGVARWLGKEDWWNTMVYSRHIPVLPRIKELMVQVLTLEPPKRPYPYDKRGEEIYTSMGRYDSPMKFEESILVWHIATNIYLRWYKAQRQPNHDLLDVTEALSNYMLFLLVARPHMLPGNTSRAYYVGVCRDLGVESGGTSTMGIVVLLQTYGVVLSRGMHHADVVDRQIDIPPKLVCSNYTLAEGAELGAKLIGEGLKGTGDYDKVIEIANYWGIIPLSDARSLEIKCDPGGTIITHRLDLLASLWLRMLFDACKGCSSYDHAKQLGNGGELLTLAALLMEHATVNSSQLLKAGSGGSHGSGSGASKNHVHDDSSDGVLTFTKESREEMEMYL